MIRIGTIALALALTSAAPVSAQQGWGNSFTPGEARDARQNGEVVPLRRIFSDLERRYGGYQLGADLRSRNGGGSEYRVDWMTKDGRRMRFFIDAQSGRIIRSSGG